MNLEDRLAFYFTPLSLSRLRPDKPLTFDLYLKQDSRFILYKHRALDISRDDIRRLRENGVETLFFHNKDRKEVRNYVEDSIEAILQEDNVPIERKAEALYESAVNVVEDIFENPRSGETIQRSRQIISHTVDFIISTPRSFVNLLTIRKHDYYTYTHSVNVCTFLVSLAQALGIHDRATLTSIGEGGLLHDLGKSMVPSAIINKRGPLTNTEWEEMRKHPRYGVEIARETRDLSDISLAIIGQHHEKPDGSGYPEGLKASELNIYANMASIVDVYDAITTSRSYSAARSSMEGAQFLLSNRHHFNEKILLVFIRMLAVKKEDS